MSKPRYYDDVKIIKKSAKKRIKNFLIFFAIMFVVGLIFLTSVYLSEALSVGNIAYFIIYGDTSIEIKSSTMYAVVLGEYDNEKDAQQVAIGSSIQGASGYVWQSNKYWVVGNVYYSQADANKVVENLKDSKYTVTIKDITFPQIKLNLSEYENKEVKIIKESLSFIDDLYGNLYNYSISFDKGECNNFGISSNLSNLKGLCKIYIGKIQDVLSNPNKDIQKIQDLLIRIDELLNDIILKTIDNSTTSYALKNAFVQIIKLKHDLYNSFQ